jgi:Zn-dependent protease
MSGGLVHLRGLPHTMQQDLAITAAGPLCNLVIGLFALGLAALIRPASASDLVTIHGPFVPSPELDRGFATYVLHATAYLNLALCLVNLVPGLPLDGGKLVYLLVEHRWNARVALLTVSALGLFFSCISMLATLASLFAGLVVWAPPYAQINWYAFRAARSGRGGWDAYAFPRTW